MPTLVGTAGLRRRNGTGDTKGKTIQPGGGAMKRSHQMWLSLGVSCLFFVLPCAGHGASLTVGDSVSVSGPMIATHYSGDGSGLFNVTATRWLVGSVAVVAQSGGDYTNPVTAMTNLSDWCPSPSASNPCLLKIMPGTYDLGTNHISMQSYVDVEGSGVWTTRIAGHGPSVVIGASSAEIRFLQVLNAGQSGVTYASAIYNSGASPRITEVAAFSQGATSSNNYAILNDNGSSPTLFRVTAFASNASLVNRGIYNTDNSSPTITRVIASAYLGNYADAIRSEESSPILEDVEARAKNGSISSYAVSNRGHGTNFYGTSFIIIRKSQLSGDTGPIFNDTNSSTLVSLTDLSAPNNIVNNGILKCVGSYDGLLDSLDSSCH
jgi:hypothetical protein